jgi:uncharacterized LabA/DUF88 family protein
LVGYDPRRGYFFKSGFMPVEPEIKNAMSFIDGQNLFRHAKAAFGYHHPNFDPLKLHKRVCEIHGWRPTLVHFYTGVPDVARNAMWAGYWSRRVLAMKRGGVQVQTRPLRYRDEVVPLPDGSTTSLETPQEKGIDVRIALDVVKLARKKQFDVAILFSQDHDLAEVAQEVREIAREQARWIKLVCAFPDGPNASFRRGVPGSDWFRMDAAFYAGCIDPRDYRPGKT